MTRILVSCYSPLKENGAPTFVCMYEGFFKALADEGNQVMVINPAFLIAKAWNGSNNELLPHIDRQIFVEAVRTFDPQLIFAFNHSIPNPILDMVTCPIVLWDADAIQFFNDKDRIKKNFDRYYFFCFALHGMGNAIEFGAPKDRVFFMPSATGIQAQDIVQDKNISFVGTMFQNHIEVKSFLKDYPNRADRDRLIQIVKRGYEHIHDDFVIERKELIEKYLPLAVLFSMYSAQKRAQTLDSVSDLGLALYGMSDWYEASKFFPDVSAAYDPTLIYSLKHNQDLYNSSKLCLNIGHSQVVDGYPWRVLDILASNGALLSDYAPGIAELLKGYIDLPMYTTPGEARALTQRLLGDEPYRRAIVEASQRCIEEKGRWKHRFAEMEKILGVTLLQSQSSTGQTVFLDPAIYNLASSVSGPNGAWQSAMARLVWCLKRLVILAMPNGLLWLIESRRAHVGRKGGGK